MKKLLFFLFFTCVMSYSQQTTSFVPKENSGKYIYVICEYKGRPGFSDNTTININWGTFNKKETIKFNQLNATPGFIIQLKYSGGTVGLRCSTDGNSIKVVQANELSDPNYKYSSYKRLSW